MKITKLAIQESDYPSADILMTYVEALSLYKKDNEDLDEEIKIHIDNLPTPRKIKQDFSIEESKILFETVNYLWKKITGSDIILENKKVKTQEPLMGNYWILRNGIIIEGENHYTAIKRNIPLISTLLDIGGFTLQYYLAGHPNKLIQFILLKGGIRMFIKKDGKGFFQLSSETYGNWGKEKIKKMDLHKKIVKIIDFNAPYKGWTNGISILL
jgi:hypothetical protein